MLGVDFALIEIAVVVYPTACSTFTGNVCCIIVKGVCLVVGESMRWVIAMDPCDVIVENTWCVWLYLAFSVEPVRGAESVHVACVLYCIVMTKLMMAVPSVSTS